jgi:hypothetical protein
MRDTMPAAGTGTQSRSLPDGRPISTLLALALLWVLLFPARQAHAADFTDVPPSHWAYTQITYVAKTNPWMADYGTGTFNPNSNELRKFWARTLVTIYAPNEPIDPNIHFKDLPDSDPFYPYANVATKLGWMPKYPSGAWSPNGPIQVSGFDKMLIWAMDVDQSIMTGLLNIHENDGDPYVVDVLFPYLQISRTLQFHYNHSDETQDIQASTYIQRDEAAYTLWKAKTLQAWQLDDLDRFKNISLGTLKASQIAKRAWTEYALSQVGRFPYIYGGEWNAASPPGYCCGTQPQAGMDCSGWVWWTMKKNENGYNSAQFRTYAGWSIVQRSSSQMAQYAPAHITFGNLQIGDLMFFASNGGSNYTDVDHVGIYAGNSWMIHVGSSNDGPAIEWVADGYYFDTFVYGRRIIGVGAPEAPHGLTAAELAGGDRGAM